MIQVTKEAALTGKMPNGWRHVALGDLCERPTGTRDPRTEPDKPFVYDKADQHLEGNGFVSDPDFRNVVTRQPRGGQDGGPSGVGGLLPGQ